MQTTAWRKGEGTDFHFFFMVCKLYLNKAFIIFKQKKVGKEGKPQSHF
jgi:hypothetical protein